MYQTDLSRSPTEHSQRYRKLKAYEERFRQERGPNTEFGRAAYWSETPRSGAKWTPLEDAELILHFRDLVPENGRLQLLGHRVYYEHVHFTFH
jgi:hypothetical protein